MDGERFGIDRAVPYARIDTIDDIVLLDTLREAGVRWLAIGIESANPRVLRDAGKPRDLVEQPGRHGDI